LSNIDGVHIVGGKVALIPVVTSNSMKTLAKYR
jgi:hypothetical protein